VKKLSDRHKAILHNTFCNLAERFLQDSPPHPVHGWNHQITWSDNHEIPMLADHTYKVTNTMNFSEGEYTAICLSYALAVMACNQLCWSADSVGENAECKFWAKLQYQLRNKYLRRKEKDVGQFLNFLD